MVSFCVSGCRLFETLQSLFWSVFGLVNLYVTNVKADHEFTEFVGATMFGTYNIISLVVLLNMLIAMMNNSYQNIAVSGPGLTPRCSRFSHRGLFSRMSGVIFVQSDLRGSRFRSLRSR